MKHQEKLQQFERLILRHMDSAFNLARWFTRNQEMAKDLTQEALRHAFKAFDRFEGEDARVWLLTIVRNLYYRSVPRKPQDQTSLDENVHSPENASHNPEGLLLRNAGEQAVRQGIEELPDDFRGPFVLREVEGLAYKEIAAVMDVPLGTVMSRLARARDYLHHYLVAALQRKAELKEGQNAVSRK